jgi:ribonuclease J
MYQWVRPQIAIPVHGEARHLLEHAELARELQIPQSIVPHNGSMIRLAPGDAEIIDEVPVGRLYLDGRMLVNEDDSHLRDRRKISYVGHVGVTIVIDKDGKLLADPVVRLQGIPERPLAGGHNLKSIIENEVLDVLEKLPTRKLKKGIELKDELKRAARRPLLAIWGKRPVVDVSVIRV